MHSFIKIVSQRWPSILVVILGLTAASAGFGADRVKCNALLTGSIKDDSVWTYLQKTMRETFQKIPSPEIIQEDGRLPWATDDERFISAVAGRAADDLLKQNSANRALLEPEDWEKVERISRAYHLTVDDLYAGRNRFLKEFILREKVNEFNSQPPFEDTLDNIITKQRYEVGFPWWVSSKYVADIGAKSRSFLKVLSPEPTAYRVVHWLGLPQGKPGISMDTVRIARNKGSKGSVEVFVKDQQGNWQPFLYDLVGGKPYQPSYWYPAQTITIKGRTKPVRETCAGCHAVDGVFSPRPVQMKTAEDFQLEGYHDQAIIRELMDPRNQ